MSLLLKKHNDQNIRWKPFATSTPLKPILVNLEDKNRTCLVRPTVSVPDISQKELDISKILQNKQSVKSKTKITGKSRSIAHFDLSSSSDEDNDHDKGDKNRPIIKIGMDSTNKVKLVTNGKCNIGSKASKNRSKIKKKLTSAKLQDKCETQKEFENQVENRSAIFRSDLENIGSNNQTVLPIGFSNHSEENHKPFCVTSKFLQNSKKEKLITNIIVKKPVLAVSNENHKCVKSTKKLLKRKDRENRDVVYVKKRRDCVTENKELQKLPEKAANSTHQLFTDSTQEELIKSLCLTMPEGDEFTTKADSLNISQKLIMNMRKNKRVKAASSKEDVSRKKLEKIEMPENQDRPKRTRQAPKKYWVIEDKATPLKDKDNGTKIPRKNFTTNCEPTFPGSSELLSQAYNVEASEGTQAVPENEEVKRWETVSGKKGQSAAKKDKVSKTGTKTESSSECPVFLPLSDVSYLENEFGHQVSQVCSMKNFKCGIFKLKPGSNYTWKKLQRSNFMGGTLVKGEMRMSIGGQECILHEGDMALVPPLSECQATNISEHESIFYYWCGRFTK